MTVLHCVRRSAPLDQTQKNQSIKICPHRERRLAPPPGRGASQGLRLGRNLQLISGGFAAAIVDHDLVGDLLAFGEAAKASALDRADMQENIGSAGIRLNETKAFLRVEPLNDTGLHDVSLSKEQVVAKRDRAFAGLIDVLGRKSRAGAPKGE